MDPIPLWLRWGREIQALAQTGQHYAVNEYDRERYERLESLAVEILNVYTGLDESYLQDLFHQQKGYATPRIDVRAAVFKDGRILMVQEKSDSGWTLPGGWADVGDLPSEAAERETWEEAGYHVKASKLIGVYDANRAGNLELFHAYKLVFLCDLLDGESRPSHETSQVAFFTRDELPRELSPQRTPLRILLDAFQAYDHPGRPAVFD
jgi:ADP-ribose pyrophosphatase YjhB (NUDIX family)